MTKWMPRLGEDNHYAVRTLSSMEKSMWRGSSSIRRGMQPQVGPSSSSQAFGKLQLRLTSLLQPHEQLEPERPRITRVLLNSQLTEIVVPQGFQSSLLRDNLVLRKPMLSSKMLAVNWAQIAMPPPILVSLELLTLITALLISAVTQSSHQEACLSICHKTERREERLMECECNPGSSTLSRH
uniref:Uncharacterized protein n=1 Tax=Rousettus aegyptiacus TaxID=9407 RepID=A0A7J8KB13_ROUAE|nr:hypothetical protein HJG63_007884 [Rousettus aegyptiacus]